MIQSMNGKPIENILNQGKNMNSLQLSTGDLFYGEIIHMDDQEMKISIDHQSNSQEMLLQMKNASQEFQVGETIALKVVEATKDILKVSVEKLETANKSSQNHDPTKDKIQVGSTKQTMLQEEKRMEDTEAMTQKNYAQDFAEQVKQIETSLSEKEYMALLKEGYDLTKMSVPMLNQFLKMHHQHTGGDFTKANVDKIKKFADKVDKVKQMDTPDVVKFLLGNKAATISEMYKSLYSGGEQLPEYVMTEADYESIKSSAHQMISKIPTQNAQELQAMTKELVMRGGALDQRSLDVLGFLNQEHQGEDVLKMALYQYENNAKLENYSISEGESVDTIMSRQEIEQALEEIQTITTKDLQHVLARNKAATLDNIIHIRLDQELQPNETMTNVQDIEESLDKEIENLNILRYQMTFKAALRLSLQGINIRTTPLDSLRSATQQIAAEHIPSDDIQSQEATEGLEQTQVMTQSPQQVWTLWQSSMARINGAATQLIADASQVLPTNQISINTLLARAKAGTERYDTLRTQVRPDLGDRIEKAFSNVDAILKDLELETTLYNQRAVEILGRNNMEITRENIQKIKLIDLPLQELQKNMMPQHIVSFLKEGKNIMNMPITTLTQAVNNKTNTTRINPVDQMIKELHQLLKAEDVPEATKESVIGVYRLMHTISSTHNAAVGFLLEHTLPVNLENLFEASKYIRQTQHQEGKMDVTIDDATGFLETVKQEGPSIMEQIVTGYYEKDMELQAFMEHPSSLEDEVESTLQEIRDKVQALDYDKIDQILLKLDGLTQMDGMQSMDKIMHLTIDEITVLEQVQKDPFMFKMLFEEMVAIAQESDVDNTWIDPLFQSYMNSLEQQTGEENGRQGIYKQLEQIKEDFLEKALERLVEKNDGEDRARSFSDVTREIEAYGGLEEKLLEDESYHTIPVMINQQIQQMNVYYFEQERRQGNQEASSSIYMQLTTEHMGTANIRIRFSDVPEVTMFATTDSGNQKMQEYEEEIRHALLELDMSIRTITYASFEVPKPMRFNGEQAKRNQPIRRYQESRFEKVI